MSQFKGRWEIREKKMYPEVSRIGKKVSFVFVKVWSEYYDLISLYI